MEGYLTWMHQLKETSLQSRSTEFAYYKDEQAWDAVKLCFEYMYGKPKEVIDQYNTQHTKRFTTIKYLNNFDLSLRPRTGKHFLRMIPDSISATGSRWFF